MNIVYSERVYVTENGSGNHSDTSRLFSVHKANGKGRGKGHPRTGYEDPEW